MKQLPGLIAFLLILSFPNPEAKGQDSVQHIVPGRVNVKEQQDKPYVILISVDGLRSDFVDRHKATNLARLRSGGVQAEYMRPSFPSLTFPNHYTIVTGLYPSHHGLVDNNFRDVQKGKYTMSNKKAVGDGSWYGGTPLWVLAEKQGMVSASFFWVASESEIQGVRPSYYYIYNEKIDTDQRLQVVKDWLSLSAEKRPHLITFYFSQVDHEAHYAGPDSSKAGDAVRYVDESIGKLTRMLEPLGLPINYIVVSDHGMTLVDNARQLSLPAGIDTVRHFTAIGESAVHLYAKDTAAIQPTYQLLLKNKTADYDVYLSTDMPERWHYSRKDDRYNRTGNIILVPQPPAFFNLSTRKNTTIGKHGFDPYHPDMRASFYAWGPAFKQQITIPGFENIHVYPMIASILGLTYDPASIDGDISVLRGILRISQK